MHLEYVSLDQQMLSRYNDQNQMSLYLRHIL